MLAGSCDILQAAFFCQELLSTSKQHRTECGCSVYDTIPQQRKIAVSAKIRPVAPSQWTGCTGGIPEQVNQHSRPREYPHHCEIAYASGRASMHKRHNEKSGRSLEAHVRAETKQIDCEHKKAFRSQKYFFEKRKVF